jgi:hypothetical protein
MTANKRTEIRVEKTIKKTISRESSLPPILTEMIADSP